MEKILIIDDEPLLRRTLYDMLSREGYAVQEAPDGRAGLQQWRNHPADLVLIDIFMPVKDGIEVVREMKRLAPQTKLVVMTGGGEHQFMDMAPAAVILGADRWIQKPFSRQDLLALIRPLLQERELFPSGFP